jgi:hypothetical protein
MAATDYYPLIARAVEGLEPDAPGEARRALYERARAALIAQLRGVQPILSDSEITRERLALEEAVRKVEAEAAQRARDRRTLNPRQLAERQAQTKRQREAEEETSRLKRALEDAQRRVQEAEENARIQRGAEAARQQRDAEQRARVQREADEQAERLREALEESQRHRDAAERQREADEEARRQQAARDEVRNPTRVERPSAPPMSVIPEQDLARAIGFSPTRKGPLDLVRDPPIDPFDKEQSELYGRIRRQIRKLKEDIPSQERSQVNEAIDDFLDGQPESWGNVEFKKLLWLSGNALRTLLAQSDSVKNDPEHYSKLPPAVAEALRNPVQAWSIFVQGDQELALLDHYSLGPREQERVRDNLVAAGEVLSKAVADRRILTERAAEAIDATMRSASATPANINTRLAQELAEKTSRNLFGQILRRAYLLREAIIDPNSQAAKELGTEVAKGAAHAAGAAALGAVLASAGHALPYLEFIATNPSIIKEYILVAFQNVQMNEIVDALEFEYNRIKKILG